MEGNSILQANLPSTLVPEVQRNKVFRIADLAYELRLFQIFKIVKLSYVVANQQFKLMKISERKIIKTEAEKHGFKRNY